MNHNWYGILYTLGPLDFVAAFPDRKRHKGVNDRMFQHVSTCFNMFQHVSTTPRVIGLGYNAVLAALMSTWQLDSAVRLLHDLPSRQIHPDTCSFNTVMGTLARQPMLGTGIVN